MQSDLTLCRDLSPCARISPWSLDKSRVRRGVVRARGLQKGAELAESKRGPVWLSQKPSHSWLILWHARKLHARNNFSDVFETALVLVDWKSPP
jgi:hypothetical protein